jgi:hypothetical protein
MRHRGRPLVLFTIAVSTAVLFAQPSDTVRNPLASNPAAALDGQRVYNATCQPVMDPRAKAIAFAARRR